MPMYSLKEYSEIIIQKQNEVYGSITKMIQMITADSEFFSFEVKIIGRIPVIIKMLKWQYH